jgi:hypothetical protein
MDHDPFTGTGQDAGPSYGYPPESERGQASAPGRDGHASAPTAGRGEAGHSEEIGRIRSFLEDQLRERPLPTLLLGVLAGWIAGKLLR